MTRNSNVITQKGIVSDPMECCIQAQVPEYCLGACVVLRKNSQEGIISKHEISFGMCEQYKQIIDNCQTLLSGSYL